LFATVFPADCRLCGAPLTNISRLPVCEACIAAIIPITGPTCEACGEGLAQSNPWDKVTLCGSCQEELPPYRKAVAYGAYDAELRELIHLLKYDQVQPAVSVLGRMLASAISKLELANDIVVVPVPLHASKRRQRGFNQAELIAHTALKTLCNKRFRLGTKVLERVKPTVSQIGLTRHQRQENIRGAFKVVHLTEVRGRELLLVDDVMTTGTTAAECARVLRRAGAEKVWVATIARTLKNSAQALVATDVAVKH
jgi:ComF family protein